MSRNRALKPFETAVRILYKHMNKIINIAPMMYWTDRHCRYFHRVLAPEFLLYTEMVTAEALLHGDGERLLGFNPAEHPVALQLGGSSPEKMAVAARLGADAGYDEININIGCPSDRVQSGRFGACLMAEPDLVRDCYLAMRDAIDIPVTVKTRIGIDDKDSWEFFLQFVEPLVDAGLERLIVHARIAILQGLSPKENRSVPPLNYPRVYRLKKTCPDLIVVLNGGIKSLSAARSHLDKVDGVMIGREAYNNPYFLAELNESFGTGAAAPARFDVVGRMRSYVESELKRGTPLHHITRHMLGLFNGQPGAKGWRRYLSEHANSSGADFSVVEAALGYLSDGSRRPKSDFPVAAT